jgi:hypothetical protein
VNLALLWLGVESQPPPEPVAMAAFNDLYLFEMELRGQVATVEWC